MMIRIAAAIAFVALIYPAQAHDGMHDDWFRSLKNNYGASCCDGSDALRVEDPSWGIEDGRYYVTLNGKKHVVSPEQLVQATNIIGYAIVWPYGDGQGGDLIRCFMPGTTS